MTAIELFGYAASITVAVSLMLRNLAWLRGLNGVGALMFVVYGVLIHARPVIILNSFIAVADFYYLAQILREASQSRRVDVARAPVSLG